METILEKYKIIKEFALGDSMVQKYIVEKDGQKCLLRIYDGRFMKGRYDSFENVSKLSQNGILVPEIYDIGTFDQGKKGYQLVQWIEGDSLDKKLNTPLEEINYGKQVGEALYQMHHVEVNESVNLQRKYEESLNRKRMRLREKKITFDDAVLYSYAFSHTALLSAYGPSIIHGDLHPGNIVIHDNQIYFIDLDVCKKDFSWRDLTCFSCNRTYPYFYTSMICSYFKGNIPNDFFKIYYLYGILYSLDYLLYCHRMPNKSLEEGLKRMNDFLEDSHSFQLDEPTWFDMKILKKERL